MPFSRCSTSCSDHAFFGTYIVHIGWGNSNQKCICGNTPPIAALKVPDSECTQNCPGDSSHKCGRAFTTNNLKRGRMNIYKVHLQGNSCAEVLIILIYPRQTELTVVEKSGWTHSIVHSCYSLQICFGDSWLHWCKAYGVVQTTLLSTKEKKSMASLTLGRSRNTQFM